MLAGGRLTIGPSNLGGTEVRLLIPRRRPHDEHTADDQHPHRRRSPADPAGISKVLDAAPDLRVVAEASDGIEAVERALREDVHLAILDVAMPRRTGLQAAARADPPPPGAAHPHALDARYRGLLLRGAQGRRLGLRSEDRRRPRARGGLPRRHARRAVPVAAHASARSCAPTSKTPRAWPHAPADAARARGGQARRRGAHERADRQAARHQPTHRRTPPREHPRQARHARPRRAHTLGDPSWPRRTPDLAAAGPQPAEDGTSIPCHSRRATRHAATHEIEPRGERDAVVSAARTSPQRPCPQCSKLLAADAESVRPVRSRRSASSSRARQHRSTIGHRPVADHDRPRQRALGLHERRPGSRRARSGSRASHLAWPAPRPARVQRRLTWTTSSLSWEQLCCWQACSRAPVAGSGFPRSRSSSSPASSSGHIRPDFVVLDDPDEIDVLAMLGLVLLLFAPRDRVHHR